MRYSIQTRLALTYIGLALIPLLVMAAFFVWEGQVLQRQQSLTLQQEIAQRVATQVQVFIQSQEDALQIVANVEKLTAKSEAEQRAVLTRLLDYQQTFAELVLIDAQGQERMRVPAAALEMPPQNFATAPEFQRPQETAAPYYGAIYLHEETNRMMLNLALPLYEQQTEQFAGVLLARLPLTSLVTILQVVSTQPYQRIYVVDQQGRVLAHNEAAFVVGGALFDLPEESGIQPGLDESSVVLAIADIPLSEQVTLRLIAEQPLGEAFAFASGTLIIITVFTLITLSVAIMLALLVIRQIFRPIKELVHVARAFSEGDLFQQFPEDRNDELGELGQAFNEMATQLIEAIEGLETRVWERTQLFESGSEIGQQIASVFDIDELLDFIIQRLKNDFGFYHVQVYLYDKTQDELVAAAEANPVATEAQRVPVDGEPLGHVITTQQSLLKNDLTVEPDFMPEIRLPQAKSLLALPLRKGEETLGVLDIQSKHLYDFPDEKISLLQSIADRLALAVDNIRLLESTQAALKEVQRLNQRLTRESWDTALHTEEALSGYRFEKGVVVPIYTPPAAAEEEKETQTPLLVADNDPTPDAYSQNGQSITNQESLIIPLQLRGQAIGKLRIKRAQSAHWAEEELDAVEKVAIQISLALENARLSEEQERTIIQLQDLDRLKTEFLTSMSHELRTPLNAILGFSDLLLQGIDGELSEYARNDVQLIYNSGQHLLALINDILDISKLEAGMMEIVPEPLVINSVIDDVLAASKSLVKDKPVTLKIDMGDDLPEVYADSIRLKQILLNLVSNAIKFTAKGSVTISIEEREITQDEIEVALETETEVVVVNTRRMMWFGITDTGIGIPEDKQAAVFERFKQADMKTTKEYGGTGLGLAICTQLVEMHGGEIGLTSEVDVGSTFYFTIPLASEILQTQDDGEHETTP